MTNDIYLREISRDDIAIINLWRNTRDSIEMLGTPFRYIDLSVDYKWYDSYQSNRANNIRLAIVYGAEIVGVTYLLSIDWLSRSAEIAIWIGEKKFQGKGFGRRSLELTLKHAFVDLNLNRIYLTVLENNRIAQQLYGDFGFFNEGLLRDSIYKNGKYQNQLIMSILAKEFWTTFNEGY